MPMNEKRRHKRFIVEGMEINGKMMFATVVSVLNISISGMSVKADRRLEIGKEYTIKLEEKNKVLSVKGLVVWSSLIGSREGYDGESVPVYAAGMKFSDVLSERVNEIIAYIERHVRNDETRLSGLRFTITKPSRAVLQFPSHYSVKKMGAGGMLIESNQALDTEERFSMELSIPEEEVIKFTGRVASCLPVNIKGIEHFDIGIEFVDMDETGKEKLHAFITMLNSMDRGS